MLHKWLLRISIVIVSIAGLSFFGWSVKEVVLGQSTWPESIQNAIRYFVGFTDLIEEAKKGDNGHSGNLCRDSCQLPTNQHLRGGCKNLNELPQRE